MPVTHYSPNEVKLAVAGYGAADKAQVQEMVVRLLSLASVPGPPDAADALALAICHAGAARVHAAVASAGASRRAARPVRTSGRRGARTGGGTMIGSVRGTVLERGGTGEVLVEVGGVGYRVLVPLGRVAALEPGAAAFLFTHLHVRDDAMVLFGFPTREERDTFEVLIGASGVGPKLALAILSVHSPGALRRALLDDDLDALTLVPGVGKRTAQRLIVELQGAPRAPRARPRRGRAAGRRSARSRCARRSLASATGPRRSATRSPASPTTARSRSCCVTR